MVGRGIEVPSAINWRGRALAVGWSNLPINCQIKHLVQNKAHSKLLDCLLIYTLIPALRKATKEGSAWDICQECIKKEEEEKCEGRWGWRDGDLRKMQASIFLELHIAVWFWYEAYKYWHLCLLQDWLSIGLLPICNGRLSLKCATLTQIWSSLADVFNECKSSLDSWEIERLGTRSSWLWVERHIFGRNKPLR